MDFRDRLTVVKIARMNDTTELAGRRPLKSRQWPVFQKLAARLAGAGISPNAISVSSTVFAAAAGLSLAGTGCVADGMPRRLLCGASAILIQLRLIANLLDGMVAIEGGRKSPVGELYNEVPDRISDPAILTGAGFAFGSHPYLGFTAALMALFIAYVRAIGATTGVGQVFLGPFAKQQRMALMTLACGVSVIFPSASLPIYEGTEMGIIAGALAVMIVGGVVTACRRLSRIANLLRQRSET